MSSYRETQVPIMTALGASDTQTPNKVEMTSFSCSHLRWAVHGWHRDSAL